MERARSDDSAVRTTPACDGAVVVQDVGASSTASTPGFTTGVSTGGRQVRGNSPASTPFQLPPSKHRVAAWTYGSKPRIRTVSPSERHPSGYVEKRLTIDGYDCTALWHQAARNEIARYTRHLTPAQQRVAKAFASDCTVGGHY